MNSSSTVSDIPDQRRVLVINPGSTSTKLGLYSGAPEEPLRLLAGCANYAAYELQNHASAAQQKELRLQAVYSFIEDARNQQILTPFTGLTAVIGRGGLLKALSGGVYGVNSKMLEELTQAKYGDHASNLGGILAAQIAAEHGCPAFVSDPVVVDELMDEARISGMPGIERRSVFHALNQKACARRVAAELGMAYEDGNFIVAHIGGGISVGAHRRGKVVDVNNALDGEGPFTVERSGSVPAVALVNTLVRAYRDAGVVPQEQDAVHREFLKRISGRGGFVGYFGFNGLTEVKEMIDGGDRHAEVIFEAMMHQIAKEVASHGATLGGQVDAVILTGGGAKDDRMVASLRQRLSWMGEIRVLPGEYEVESLAENALRVLDGTQGLNRY